MEDTEEQKPTLGEQLVKVQTDNAGRMSQTIGETTEGMAKEYLKSLEQIINDHKHVKEKYYIMELIKVDQFMEGVVRLKHIARKTRPRPEWGVALYAVDNQSGTLTFEWGLPTIGEAEIVMSAPEGWDPFLVGNIRDFVNGTLV